MIRFESSTKINFISPALRAWGWGTLLIMQWASEVAYLSSYKNRNKNTGRKNAGKQNG